MAHDQKRIRTVFVRLLCVMPAWVYGPVARRLLAIAGLVLAGWLLAGTGPAHADARPATGTGAGTSAGTLTVGGLQDAVPVDVPSLHRSLRSAGPLDTGRLGTGPLETGRVDIADRVAVAPAPPARVTSRAATPQHLPPAAGSSVPGASSPRGTGEDRTGSLRELRCDLLVCPVAVLDSLDLVRPVDADVMSSAGPSPRDPGAGSSWTPRQRHHADAGIGDRAGTHVPRSLAVSGASKGGRAAFGAVLSHPAPFPGTGVPAPLQRWAQAPVTPGAASMGGGHAVLAGSGSTGPAACGLVPATRAAAPAVHSATDEPSCSPD